MYWTRIVSLIGQVTANHNCFLAVLLATLRQKRLSLTGGLVSFSLRLPVSATQMCVCSDARDLSSQAERGVKSLDYPVLLAFSFSSPLLRSTTDRLTQR